MTEHRVLSPMFWVIAAVSTLWAVVSALLGFAGDMKASIIVAVLSLGVIIGLRELGNDR